MYELSRQQMLPIMEESGAMSELDINKDDFLGGHGREDTHVRAIQIAYNLGMDHGMDLMSDER